MASVVGQFNTAQDIITYAFRKAGLLGLGQQMDGQDNNDGLVELNGMLAQWQRKRYLVFHLNNQIVTCTGATTYTVGPGLQFNFPNRPERVESAFLRIINATANPNFIDYPLKLIYAREEYDRIRLKTLSSISGSLFYDPAWPTGVLYPWPVPQASIYQLGVTFKDPLPQFTTLGATFSMPIEYGLALAYNLALRFRQAYGKGLRPDPELKGLAKDALNVLREANVNVPELYMPKAVRGSVSGYDYHSDTPGP